MCYPDQSSVCTHKISASFCRGDIKRETNNADTSAREQKGQGASAVLRKGSSEKLLEHSQHYRGVMEVVSKHIYLTTRDYVGESGVRQAQEMGEFLPAGWWCLNLRGGEGRGEGVGAAWQDVGMHCVDPGIRLAKSGEWGVHRGDELEWRIEAEHQKQTNEHMFILSLLLTVDVIDRLSQSHAILTLL